VFGTSRRRRAVWLIAALLAVALASLTKETGAVGFLAVGIVVWNGLAHPRRSMVLTALGVTIPMVVAALVVANGDTESALIDLPQEFVVQLHDETFAGSPWFVVAAVMAILLIAWAIPRATAPLPLAGLVLISPAVALGLYSSGTGLGMRNAALLPYGIALLLGSFVSSLPATPARPAMRSVWLGIPFALVVASFAGSAARAWGPSDVAERNWDNAGSHGVADFLRAHRDQGTAACTLDYCSFYWLAAEGDVDLALLPQYSARLGPTSVDDLDFTRRAGFRGPVAASPPCTGVPLVVTKSDEGFGTIFECALLHEIRATKPRYLVVSGSSGSDTFDAARLIPYLEANPAFRRVYSTTPADLRHVVAVYEVVGDPKPVRGAPAYYSASAYEALPEDHSEPGVTVLDGACYAATLQAILSRPPRRAAVPAPDDTEPGSCHTVTR
jgi:hypothetical protein